MFVGTGFFRSPEASCVIIDMADCGYSGALLYLQTTSELRVFFTFTLNAHSLYSGDLQTVVISVVLLSPLPAGKRREVVKSKACHNCITSSGSSLAIPFFLDTHQ